MAIQQKDKGNFGGSMADSARDAANKTSDAAKDAASNVAHKASEAGSYISHKVEDATSSTGSGMRSVADSIRDRGPHEGMLGQASSAVADTLDTYGRELEERGLSGIADDLANTVRRHPVPSVLIGIGLGFMLARMVAK